MDVRIPKYLTLDFGLGVHHSFIILLIFLYFGVFKNNKEVLLWTN